ncbi:MAG: cupin domain-containing protein [Deltaproteobacteria bacterium]|nr:cupin domain-containing protein [Deltaproteobacteria bacterium]
MFALLTLLFASTPAEHVIPGERAPKFLILDERGMAQLLVNAATGAGDVALSVLTLAPGAVVAEHVHETSSETLYVERGEVEMTIAGKLVRAKAGDAIYIPKGTLHSARVAGTVESVRVVQVYVGPGPEQRFSKGKVVK